MNEVNYNSVGFRAFNIYLGNRNKEDCLEKYGQTFIFCLNFAIGKRVTLKEGKDIDCKVASVATKLFFGFLALATLPFTIVGILLVILSPSHKKTHRTVLKALESKSTSQPIYENKIHPGLVPILKDCEKLLKSHLDEIQEQVNNSFIESTSKYLKNELEEPDSIKIPSRDFPLEVEAFIEKYPQELTPEFFIKMLNDNLAKIREGDKDIQNILLKLIDTAEKNKTSLFSRTHWNAENDALSIALQIDRTKDQKIIRRIVSHIQTLPNNEYPRIYKEKYLKLIKDLKLTKTLNKLIQF